MITIGQITLWGLSSLSLLLGLGGGVFYRRMPANLKEYFEHKGLTIVKDGTDMVTINKIIERNKAHITTHITKIQIINASDSSTSSTEDNSSKEVANTIALKEWCRDRFRESTKEADVATKVKTRKYCIIEDD